MRTPAGRDAQPAPRSGSARSPALRCDAAIMFGGSLESGGRLGRVEQRLDQKASILDRKPDDLGLLDRTMCGLLGGRDHEVADAASLDFGSALDDAQRIGGYTRFDARGTGRSTGHGHPHPPRMYGRLPNKSSLPVVPSDISN